MSEIRVNTIKSEDGASPVSFNKGVNVTGVAQLLPVLLVI